MNNILPLAKQLLKEVDFSIRPIRLIGLTVSNPKQEHNDWKQLELEFAQISLL